jgi:hypothetical protein
VLFVELLIDGVVDDLVLAQPVARSHSMESGVTFRRAVTLRVQ